ncbi:MAG: site-2 protease family protein [bacterium]
MLTIIIAIVSIIGLLVLHELGHFIIAKFFKIKVEEFGVGYPPKIFGKKIGDTIYSLNWLPFGAFVRIPGPDGEGESTKDAKDYERKPAWQKAAVLLGGVVSFWIIAAILLSIAFSIGVPRAISDTETENLVNVKVQILAASLDSPAKSAGLKPGDAITGFRVGDLEVPIQTVEEVQEFTQEYKGQEVIVLIDRGEESFEAPLTLRIDPPEDEGSLGVMIVRTADQSYSWKEAPILGIQSTADLTVQVVVGWGNVLKSLFTGEGMPDGVQFIGPIGIGSLLNQAAKIGVNYFLQFIAMIAIYLAVLNILPIPALDGGRLVFLAIEKIKGRPINRKIEQRINGAVFFILLILMAFVTIKDVSNLF